MIARVEALRRNANGRAKTTSERALGRRAAHGTGRPGERRVVTRAHDPKSDVDNAKKSVDMDAMWEKEAVRDVEATEIGAKRETAKDQLMNNEARNRALAGLLDQALLDRKQLERALTATIEATRAENVALRVEIERIKANAELLKSNDKERAKLYASVEKDLEKRVRLAIEKQLNDKAATFKAQAASAQQEAIGLAQSAEILMKQLGAKYDADMAETLKVLKWSYEEDLDAERAKFAEMEMRKNALEEQNRAQAEFVSSYNRVLDEKAKLERQLIDKEELLSTLSQSEERMKKKMQEAIARATASESKLVDVDKQIKSKVKLTLENAEMCVENAERIKNEAERAAAEQKKVAEQMLNAAMIRAEAAEAQLVRQKDLLDEFAALTAAKASASTKFIELSQHIAAQNAELQSLREAVGAAESSAISWQAKATSLEENSNRKLVKTTSSAKDAMDALKKETDLALATSNDNADILRKSLEAKNAEITALQAHIESIEVNAKREHERFDRERHAQELLLENWRHREKLREQLNKYDESDEQRESHMMYHDHPKGRLTTNFSGPKLRAFIADGWRLPKEVIPVFEQGIPVTTVLASKVIDPLDPVKERMNADKLGTVGLRSARLLDDVGRNVMNEK